MQKGIEGVSIGVLKTKDENPDIQTYQMRSKVGAAHDNAIAKRTAAKDDASDEESGDMLDGLIPRAKSCVVTPKKKQKEDKPNTEDIPKQHDDPVSDLDSKSESPRVPAARREPSSGGSVKRVRGDGDVEPAPSPQIRRQFSQSFQDGIGPTTKKNKQKTSCNRSITSKVQWLSCALRPT